jgi:hypothetical protein
MIGIESKKEFETLLREIEASGEDPMLFIRDYVHGKHISGNHRYHVKQNYMIQNRDKFLSKPYWYLTLSQLYIGLRSDQARYVSIHYFITLNSFLCINLQGYISALPRYLACANNEGGKTRIEDRQASKLLVRTHYNDCLVLSHMSQLLITATMKNVFVIDYLIFLQNLRRAFELQSTQKWNTFRAEHKAGFLKSAGDNMDMAKDYAFLTYLNMGEKKYEFDVKSKS